MVGSDGVGMGLTGRVSAVSYRRVRILVTNDDGVHSPGLGVLAGALAALRDAEGRAPDVVVVAPLANHSGAGAAVGAVYEREAIGYRVARLEQAPDVPAYGLDASPALSVIVGALGGFGPRPDLVVSGINLGVNVGRSILHSGTVGATLTGSQLGISGLAVSMRSNTEDHEWSTAAALAAALVAPLAAAAVPTVWNLNVPSVPLADIRGVRHGRVSGAGIIKAADAPGTPSAEARTFPSGGGLDGEIRLTLGSAVPELGDVTGEDPEDDAALVGQGFASLTALRTVSADDRPGARDQVDAGIDALAALVGP
jgi:5'-nucleotidase